MHKAWCNVEEVPYNFSGSSVEFQGHTGWKIYDFNPISVRLLGRSQLSNLSDLPCLCLLYHICTNKWFWRQGAKHILIFISTFLSISCVVVFICLCFSSFIKLFVAYGLIVATTVVTIVIVTSLAVVVVVTVIYIACLFLIFVIIIIINIPSAAAATAVMTTNVLLYPSLHHLRYLLLLLSITVFVAFHLRICISMDMIMYTDGNVTLISLIILCNDAPNFSWGPDLLPDVCCNSPWPQPYCVGVLHVYWGCSLS